MELSTPPTGECSPLKLLTPLQHRAPLWGVLRALKPLMGCMLFLSIGRYCSSNSLHYATIVVCTVLRNIHFEYSPQPPPHESASDINENCAHNYYLFYVNFLYSWAACMLTKVISIDIPQIQNLIKYTGSDHLQTAYSQAWSTRKNLANSDNWGRSPAIQLRVARQGRRKVFKSGEAHSSPLLPFLHFSPCSLFISLYSLPFPYLYSLFSSLLFPPFLPKQIPSTPGKECGGEL